MQELEPTWGRALAVWWLIFWRSMLGALLLGAAVGFVIGIIGAIFATKDFTIRASGVFGLLIGVAWFVAVVRMALRKQYGDFPHRVGSAHGAH